MPPPRDHPKLAKKYKLPDLSPLGIEQAMQAEWETKFLKPAQQKVEAVLKDAKADIEAILPGAKIGYTGSLATGWKGPHKVPRDAAALRFSWA